MTFSFNSKLNLLQITLEISSLVCTNTNQADLVELVCIKNLKDRYEISEWNQKSKYSEMTKPSEK